jgi:PrtD family type I secretion system ABC transporter
VNTHTRQSAHSAARPELWHSLLACRAAFVGVGLMSAVLNILFLTGSFFMLEVYDRVIPSRSVSTLVGLTIIAGMMFAFQGGLEILRGRILVRIGISFDNELRLRVYDVLVRSPLTGQNPGDALQPMRDLDKMRGFFSGLGPAALFDLPWMPLYLVICYSFHPLIGITALGGCVLLLVLTLLTETLTRRLTSVAIRYGARRFLLAEKAHRNAEVIQAMGMAQRLARRWDEANALFLVNQRQLSDVAGGLGSISRVLRTALQSAVIAVGAYLVIEQQATAGIIIASSILTARSLAPVENAIANWKGFVEARFAWRRLAQLLALLPARDATMALPAPRHSLAVEASAAPPGLQRFVVDQVRFTIEAASGLGIVGPSASGKSSLARLLAGVWEPVRGSIRLDGATLNQWAPEALGPHIGYLPQDIELIAGTIAENISRFAQETKFEAIIAAGRAAGVHDLIVGFPDGYDTQIGEAGVNLSAGQRQRIALARALYGDPFLIVLDEPSSNLDDEGEKALLQAINGIRARRGIVVVVTHDLKILAGCDLLLVMAQGRQQAFGPRDQILRPVAQLAPPFPVPTAANLGVVGGARKQT